MGFLRPSAHTCAKLTKSIVSALLLGLITLGAFTFAAPINANAGQAALNWAPDTSTGVIGYKVYWGTASGSYTQSIDVGNATSYTITSLTDGQKYYFAATAYNSSGTQSGYSNEVSKTMSTIYTITATAGANGTIAALNNSNVTTSASGTSTTVTATVTGGASQTFSITPSTGYSVSGVTVDGASVGAVTSYSFSNVTANHTISATFAANAVNTYTLTASAGTGGSITPTGATTVTSGGSQSYAIAPASGYSIAGVTVDGASVGAVSTYTFSSVNANHTIAASFTANTVSSYSITATAGTGGSITPAGTTTLTSGGSQAYTITPASGYVIAAVTVDGASAGAVSSYSFSNVTANHTISATFSLSSTGNVPQTNWVLKYVDSQETVGENGGAINAFDGQVGTLWHTQWYNVTPTPCPHEVQIDMGSSYALTGFSYLPRQDGGINGTIAQYEFYVSSDGVNWGTPVATGTFANNTQLKQVPFGTKTARYIRLRALSEVNGGAWTSAAEINVTGTPATVAPTTYTISASSGTGGKITPSGTATVNAGASASYSITPSSHYKIVSVVVDGASRGAISSYTFSNIAANHTIQATFVHK